LIFIDWKHEAGLARGDLGKLTAGKGSVWNRLRMLAIVVARGAGRSGAAGVLWKNIGLVVSVLRIRRFEKMVNRNRFRAVSATVVHYDGGWEIGRGNGLIVRGGIPSGELPGHLGAAAS